MNIIEVKNNLVKLSYEEDIVLGAFIKISDLKGAYIAQILHLESSRIGKIAIARLIFNFKTGIQAYDGSIPSIQSDVEILNNDFIANFLDKTDPLLIGKLNQSDTEIVVSSSLLKDKPIICAEKSYQYKLLLENLINQNEINNRKTVVFDLTGEIQGNKIVATKDFMIPLNKDSIDYIFDRGFEDLTQENKAFIQDIFSELSEYIKTVEFIPFNDFNAVIEYEFKRTQKLQLIILKNRLTQFEKANIFAQQNKDFRILDEKLVDDNTLIIDLSRLNDSLQNEYIMYVYKQMEQKNTNFYSFVSLNNSNTSKDTLNILFGAKNIFTSIACPYSYKYINELKQCSKNMFMFTPIKQQNDFGAYNIFLNRLNENEFILYGKTTKFTPLIIKLEEIKDFTKLNGSTDEVPILSLNMDEIPVMEIPQEDLAVVPKQEEVPSSEEQIEEIETPVMETPQENLAVVPEQDEVIPSEGQTEEIETPVMEIPQENLAVVPEQEEVIPSEGQIEEIETPVMEIPQEDSTVVSEQEEVPSSEEQISEIDNNVLDIENSKDDISQDVMALEVQQELAKISIDIEDDEIADAVTAASRQVSLEDLEEAKTNLDPSDLFKANTELNETQSEITEDESILTDADLDMIESLQQDTPTSIEEHSSEEIIKENIEDNVDGITDNEEQLSSESKISVTDQILQEEAEKKALEEANKIDPIEEQIEKPENIQQKHEEKLETKQAQTPIVPVYSAEIPDEDIVESDNIKQGDTIVHPEFGKGVVEKLISYGERILCSVNFDQVGRRLLDPKISEMKKIN